MDYPKMRKDFIKTRGFKNLSVFARAVDEYPSNIHKIIKGIQLPKVERLLQWAIVLDCDIEQLITLFYPNEMRKYVEAKNRKYAETKNQNITGGENHV